MSFWKSDLELLLKKIIKHSTDFINTMNLAYLRTLVHKMYVILKTQLTNTNGNQRVKIIDVSRNNIFREKSIIYEKKDESIL